MDQEQIYSVSSVNKYIKNLFARDSALRYIAVRGEVSNVKYHTSGHIYFSLKDDTTAMACVMFAGQRRGLAFSMKNGDSVVVKGSVDVYERDGRYQLYAREILQDGRGLLYERFLALKDRLEEMGMFDAAYKKPIPPHVRRLGIVTAPTGAAVQDIRNISLRRNPFVQLILYPAQVQGEGAKESIARGLKLLDAMDLDVIIVGRGGGSLEDLWAFNEEMVARAIFECKTPVISAVGHETDVTISDLVADRRASTPSAGAELAVEDLSVTLRRLTEYDRRLHLGMEGKLAACQQRLSRLSMRLSYLSPDSQLREKRQRLADLQALLERRMTDKLRERRNRLGILSARLEGLSPLKKLAGGYSYVQRPDGRALTAVGQVREGDVVKIHVTDGTVSARVEETRMAQMKGGEA